MKILKIFLCMILCVCYIVPFNISVNAEEGSKTDVWVIPNDSLSAYNYWLKFGFQPSMTGQDIIFDLNVTMSSITTGNSSMSLSQYYNHYIDNPSITIPSISFSLNGSYQTNYIDCQNATITGSTTQTIDFGRCNFTTQETGATKAISVSIGDSYIRGTDTISGSETFNLTTNTDGTVSGTLKGSWAYDYPKLFIPDGYIWPSEFNHSYYTYVPNSGYIYIVVGVNKNVDLSSYFKSYSYSLNSSTGYKYYLIYRDTSLSIYQFEIQANPMDAISFYLDGLSNVYLYPIYIGSEPYSLGSKVSSLNSKNQELISATNQYDQVENEYINNATDSIDNIDFNLDLTSLNDFTPTATFVGNQMTSLFNINPALTTVFMFSMILGICLLLIGRSKK